MTPSQKAATFDYKHSICFSQMLHGTNYDTNKLTLSLRPQITLHKEMIRLPSIPSQKVDSGDYKYHIVLFQSHLPLLLTKYP